jgi:hypothetical protein
VGDDLAPCHRHRVAVPAHGVTTTVPRMNGWIEQT